MWQKKGHEGVTMKERVTRRKSNKMEGGCSAILLIKQNNAFALNSSLTHFILTHCPFTSHISSALSSPFFSSHPRHISGPSSRLDKENLKPSRYPLRCNESVRGSLVINHLVFSSHELREIICYYLWKCCVELDPTNSARGLCENLNGRNAI